MGVCSSMRATALGLALSAWAMAGAAAGQDLIVADFENGLPPGLRASGATAERGAGNAEAAEGYGFLRLKPDAGADKMLVRLPLPARTEMTRYGALRAAIRVPEGERPVPLRWHALDEAGRPMFQRRFELRADGRWARVEEPLAAWRWGNQDVGRWEQVKTLALAVEAPAGELLLDDLRLAPAQGDETAYPSRKWLLGVAFPEGGAKVVAEDGFLVASDAAEATEDDLRKVLAQMQRARRWVDRVFEGALLPAQTDRPISMFIFGSPEKYQAFFKRLGATWRADIAAPRSGGYTVQDITGTTWSAQYGADRPVFLHEAVHAIAVRRLGVRLEVEDRGWFHEGLANYVQLCVYPKSLDWRTYERNFAVPVAADGSTFFKPFASILPRRATTEHYAQWASLTAFLVEERPDWLPKIAKGLAAGEPAPKVLEACGTDCGNLQAEWFAWGVKKFAGDQPAGQFALPKEWSGP